MRSIGFILLCCLIVTSLALDFDASADEVRDYEWFLRQVADLDRLPYLEEGVVSRQFSSYHRASHYDRETGECVNMDQNGDAGHRLSVHFGPEAAAEFEEFGIPPQTPRYAFGDLEWVLDPLERNHVFFFPQAGTDRPETEPPENIVATIPGPGCIYRIWSANPMGKIRFYFNGNTEPLEFDFQSLFLKGVERPDEETLANRRQWPFIRPMTFRRAGEQDRLASDCYLPIPFSKSCIITLTRPSFYQFGYKTFPDDTQVETFHLPLSGSEGQVLGEVCDTLMRRGENPRTEMARTSTISQTMELAPGASMSLADLDGPGIVEAIHAKLDGNERYAHSKVLLEAYFDDESDPSIWTPIVNFFGTGFVPNDYRSYPLGYIDGEGYCYFPMPFRDSARFLITNQGTQPATLQYRLTYRRVEELPPNTMHFKCKYRREQVCSTFDYPFLEAEGQGRFVGAELCIDDAWRSWWGEGDEKIWVDDDVFPSFFGTGSEDFFGDAWGIRTLHMPYYACSLRDATADHSWTCCYRWMVPDDVPFYSNFRATIENYPETQWGTQAVEWDEDYVSVAYWYHMPGGSDFFEPVPVEDRRPWGKVPRPPVVEAETALADELDAGARIVNDEGLDHEFSRGRCIDLGAVEAGDEVSFRGPELILAGPYMVRVHKHVPADAPGPAGFELVFAGENIGSTPDDYADAIVSQVGAGVFETGRPQFTIRFTSAGSAVFDCFQLAPARQLNDVVEAEKMNIVSGSGPEPVTDTGVAWSAGHQLRFPAEPGDSIQLEANMPDGNWHICLGLTKGPQYGNYNVFVNGQPVGSVSGYAQRMQVQDWLRMGTLEGKNGRTTFRFVCTGKEDAADGHSLGLDYIGWQRIIVPGAIEGEAAQITEVKDGRITVQDLGRRYSGGKQLWFHPEKVGASFVWPLDVPEDGRYEVSVYFTKSWDYANVRVYLDGTPIETYDTYAPTVVWDGKSRLGVFELQEPEARLKFEAVGKNEKSKGILIGIDCVTLEPVE